MDWEKYTGKRQAPKAIELPSIEEMKLQYKQADMMFPLPVQNHSVGLSQGKWDETVTISPGRVSRIVVDASGADKMEIPGYKVVPDRQLPSFDELWAACIARCDGDRLNMREGMRFIMRTFYETLSS